MGQVPTNAVTLVTISDKYLMTPLSYEVFGRFFRMIQDASPTTPMFVTSTPYQGTILWREETPDEIATREEQERASREWSKQYQAEQAAKKQADIARLAERLGVTVEQVAEAQES